ncbi:DMP19 family protein [Neisseria sp.]|uniref:DMP19 family protein n=1 Tax=Neisseria sp. TaxID=192066 RepID=UPI00359FEFDB
MNSQLNLQDFDTGADTVGFLYAVGAALLEYTEAAGDADMTLLNDAQHTLVALCYLDSQVQEGGFVQLIAQGFGSYVFDNPVADSLRRWRIKPVPKILDKAVALYRKHGADIERLASDGLPAETLRAQFADFEELDADYYDAADEDLAAAAAYVREHWAEFARTDKAV